MTRSKSNRNFLYQDGYGVDWRGYPPHMTPHEQRMWYAWLDQHQPAYDEVWYDVKTDGVPHAHGHPNEHLLHLDAQMQRLHHQLTARRCDVIARQGSRYQLIELRRVADAQTIGEVQIYKQLLATEFPQLDWMPPMVITEQISSTAKTIMQSNGWNLQILEGSAAR